MTDDLAEKSAEEAGRAARRQLEDWPYVPHHLQATLDHELIEHHGLAILHRALNVGRLAAFVSSGVSMSYGRLSWSALVQALVREDKQPTPDPDADTRVIERLTTTLGELKITERSPGDDLQSGRFPAAFQFCEQLWIASRGRRGKQEFRDKVKRLLFDDRGHAQLLLEDLAKDIVEFTKAEKPSSEKDPSDGQPTTGDGAALKNKSATAARDAALSPRDKFQDAVNAFFEWDPEKTSGTAWEAVKRSPRLHDAFDRALLYDANGDSVPQHWRKLLAAGHAHIPTSPAASRTVADGADRLVQAITSDRKRRAALPTHRFLVTAAARLWIAGSEEHEAVEAFNKTSQEQFLKNGVPTEFRAQNVPPELDPLAILSDKLGIRRFVTTNFDLDIEQLMADRGFTPERRDVDAEGPERATRVFETVNPLGATAADAVLSAQRAVDLIDFAVNPGHHAYNLIHLHGRAARGNDLVVTERDYLNLYLKRGADHDVVSDALEIGFGSNPLLFVGNGMGEDDILRPLRQFVSERSSDTDRQAVALLPALGSKARQIEETIAIYSRYGVHTVHFGFADLVCTDTKKGPIPARWLALSLKMAADLAAIFEALGDTLAGKQGAKEQVRDKLREIGRAYRASQKEDTNHDEREPRHWFDLLVPDENGRPRQKLREILRLDMVSVRRTGSSALYPKVEVAVLEAAWQTLKDICGKINFSDTKARYAKSLSLPDTPDERLALRRVAFAYRRALEGLPDALISLSLCAKLNHLHESWMTWKRNWYALPMPRLTGGPFFDEGSPDDPSPDAVASRRVYERHPLALRPPPHAPSRRAGSQEEPARDKVPRGDRFFAGSPSKAFSTLFSALRAARDVDGSALRQAPENAGRRLFVLLGQRGVGKGHFFEAFRAKRRLDAFIAASWRTGTAPDYPAAAMLNLSLSMEVASTFDRIAHVLVECARSKSMFREDKVSEAVVRKIEAAGQALRRDRIGRLARILELYSDHSAAATGRILFAVSGFNVLFNRGGMPKNGQIARLLEALLGTRSASAPIDFVLLCDESGFPSIFRRAVPNARTSFCGVSPMVLDHLVRPDIDDEGQRLLDALVTKYRIATVRHRRTSRPMLDRLPTRQPSAFLHVLHLARASLTVGTYFPLVSLALAAEPGKLSGWEDSKLSPLPMPPVGDRRLIQDEIIGTMLHLEHNRAETDKEPDETMTQVIPHAWVGLAEQLRTPSENSAPKAFKTLIKEVFASAVNCASQPLPNKAALLDADFKYLFHLFDHNRFLLTIACAAGTEIAASDTENPTFCPGDIVGWFKDLASAILGLPLASRPQAVIDYVLRFYGQGHGRKMSLPTHCQDDFAAKDKTPLDGSGIGSGNVAEWLKGPQGWRLQQALLWHLAVCSHPIEADVLAAAPKIADALRSLPGNRPAGTPIALKAAVFVVQAALDIMVHRCLIFRLWDAVVASPEVMNDKVVKSSSTGENTWRFTLHRLMQSSIFLRLHAPSVESHVVDQYTLSLYGTLPNDLPRPRAEVIQDLDDLISVWTGFPRDLAAVERDGAFHDAFAASCAAGADHGPASTLPARFLRAAFGVIRSVYSVSVVSRFDDFSDSDGPPVPAAGYFEQHRLQNQWLLQKAVDLSYASKLRRIYSGENYPNESRDAPFYAEEIVWLYNECALLSLIEGRLDDAELLFDSAFAAARGIEVDAETSPLRVRLTLNSALVDLERGRVGTARRRFGSVERQENEHPAIRAVAHGYVGLCAHVDGDLVTARNRYEDAIARLRDTHHARGVAIFSRHLADLLRASGAASAEGAYRAADQAIAHAQRGGHEDVHQNARLSRVRIDISLLPSTLQTGRIQTELDNIERYGEVMGIPRLACEVAYARATFLLAIGETQHATTLARRSLRIATQHDLKLRQVAGLVLMARIYERRGLTQPAADLFGLANVFANLCEYRSARFATSRR